MLERRLEKTKKAAKADKAAAHEVNVIEQIIEVLEEGKTARTLNLSHDDANLVKSFNLLSSKPVIYVANVSDDDLADNGANNEYVAKVREFASTEDAEVIVISAQIEQEIAQLDAEERVEFFKRPRLRPIRPR